MSEEYNICPKAEQRSWNRQVSIQRFAALALAMTIGILTIATYLRWDPHGLYVTDSEWDSLMVGMTKGEIRDIMGHPSSDQGSSWMYNCVLDIFTTYHLEFDQAERLDEKYTMD